MSLRLSNNELTGTLPHFQYGQVKSWSCVYSMFCVHMYLHVQLRLPAHIHVQLCPYNLCLADWPTPCARNPCAPTAKACSWQQSWAIMIGLGVPFHIWNVPTRPLPPVTAFVCRCRCSRVFTCPTTASLARCQGLGSQRCHGLRLLMCRSIYSPARCQSPSHLHHV